MRIIVEDTETELDLPHENITLGQVIQEVEDFLFEVGKIPVALAIDDKQLTQEELETGQEKLMSGNETLKFGVMTVFEFLKNNLEGATQANTELLKTIQTFAKEIHSPTKTIEQGLLVLELNNFFDFWFKLSHLLPEQFKQVVIKGKSFEQCFDDLRAFFEEIVKAMEDHDFVLAADLLQYEVVPLIEEVHHVIPALKEQLSVVNAEASS